MPNCKYCHKSISRFDSDVCPHCGAKNPIDEGYETKDMTQFVDPVTGEYELYRSKSRKAAGFLCLFLGVFGAHHFYLGYTRKGLFTLLASLLISLGIGLPVAFLLEAPLSIVLGLAPFLLLFLFYAVLSVRYFRSETIKDANGEFLR